ncbi:MAG TPA: sensor histidine kinase KdpD [Bacteroidales bacterium]|jgi:two-component system sensor histidine kinase KdpD|nr:sensor histidine kinase KdpD [Bacteroidales bacterium]
MTEPHYRPDPDSLLASLKAEEEKSRKGSLKIFFGMCAGVGKTYTMLETAQAEKRKGFDIIIGYIETHKRSETEELTKPFEIIPRKELAYKSVILKEMDIDAIIARKPYIAIVDELAHTNVPGSRHDKRMQDILELLDNGINVYTTLNVQHLESRSELVSQITGITVRETVPDEIFEKADEVELIDLTPAELLQRLAEGKVYSADKTLQATSNFFKISNITALRELALRIVADRVDKQLHDIVQDKQIKGPWKTGQHVLVAIGWGPFSGRLLRWAKMLSYSMGATIQAVFVEPAGKLPRSSEDQLNRNISLAKKLGIKFSIISNLDRVKGILNFAQKENITHIIVGKPRTGKLISLLNPGNLVNRLIRESGNIDVFILGADKNVRDKVKERIPIPSFTSRLSDYAISVIFVMFISLILYPLRDVIGYQTVSLVLLFLVSILALFFGIGPILVAASLSAIVWDYFFIPPQFTFHISKPLDVMMLTMFFIIALLNGILTARTRRQEKKIRVREERTQALYQLTKDLNSVSGYEDAKKTAESYIRKYFNLSCHIFLKGAGQLDFTENLTVNDRSIAEWVFKNSQKAGKNTDTLPSSRYTFYPLAGTSGSMGVLVTEHQKIFTFGEEQFWENSLSQISAKFEREFYRDAARKSYVVNESEKLYKTLFNSISHELRIPVTTIMAASENLLSDKFDEETRTKLYGEISTASVRLNRLIDNLLNMSRLETGRISPKPDWCDVNDLVNSVQDSLRDELKPFNLSVVIPSEMPLVYLDFGLMEHVIHNLLLNATQHAPEGSQIRLKFFYDNGLLNIQVMDRGKGFEESELPSVFNKFYRGKDAASGGTGLGLSIVRGFVEAHGGTVRAENRENGGARISVRIPCKASFIPERM